MAEHGEHKPIFTGEQGSAPLVTVAKYAVMTAGKQPNESLLWACLNAMAKGKAPDADGMSEDEGDDESPQGFPLSDDLIEVLYNSNSAERFRGCGFMGADYALNYVDEVIPATVQDVKAYIAARHHDKPRTKDAKCDTLVASDNYFAQVLNVFVSCLQGQAKITYDDIHERKKDEFKRRSFHYQKLNMILAELHVRTANTMAAQVDYIAQQLQSCRQRKNQSVAQFRTYIESLREQLRLAGRPASQAQIFQALFIGALPHLRMSLRKKAGSEAIEYNSQEDMDWLVDKLVEAERDTAVASAQVAAMQHSRSDGQRPDGHQQSQQGVDGRDGQDRGRGRDRSRVSRGGKQQRGAGEQRASEQQADDNHDDFRRNNKRKARGTGRDSGDGGRFNKKKSAPEDSKAAEKRSRRDNDQCFLCGLKGHYASNCPSATKGSSSASSSAKGASAKMHMGALRFNDPVDAYMADRGDSE